MRRRALAVVYLAVFLDLLGFGIILPSLPYFAERLGATGLWLGVVLTSYSLAQLIGAVLLGRLSDRIGRRPVLLAALAGSAVSFVLTGLAPTLPLLAAARALAGLFGGSVSAAQAYVADVTRPEERARFMGYLGAATGLGFVVGPALGALLAPFGFAAAAFAAAALAAGNFVVGLGLLSESLPASSRGARRRPDWRELRRVAARPAIARILAAIFLTMFGFVGMETTLAYLGAARFGLEERSFGLLLVLAGGVSIGVQGGLIGPLTGALGERRLAAVGIVVMGAALAVLPLATGFAAAAAFLALAAAGRALSLPGLSTLLSRASPAEAQGATLGLGQSLAAAARAVGPLTAGWLYDLAPAAPYGLAGVLSLAAAVAVAGAPAPAADAD